MQQYPAPWVWKYGTDESWQRDDTPSRPALETWNWCREFVLKLQLCPWAKASLETKNALHIFVAPKRSIAFVEDVAKEFSKFCAENPTLESAAIFFVLFVEDEGSFIDFYNWFEELEDDWMQEEVIVAPFHPDWEFAGEAESLQYEKRSPHPAVSIVSALVVEQAGAAATEQIGIQNEAILLDKDPLELEALWTESCRIQEGLDSSFQ
jgi:hypothetical protein